MMGRHRVRAMITMLIAVATFSLMDVGLKLLSAHYPPFEVAALRGASSLPWVLAWTLGSAGLRALRPVSWRLHLLRAGMSIAMMAAFVYALRTLPLANAYSLFFVAPLLITAMSGPMLGERVGSRRWAAIGVGLIGVLVLLRPTGHGLLSTAALAVLLAASMYALNAITVRWLARTDTPQAMVVWLLTLMALGAGALAAPRWVSLQGEHVWLVAGVGLAGAIGQYTITEAFRLGEASLLAPLEYTALVWGVLFDLVLWHTLPDGVTWIGAAIIVASGVYLLRRETVHVEAEHP
jgi:drug/metabolite transporter (DMT)-like permease